MVVDVCVSQDNAENLRQTKQEHWTCHQRWVREKTFFNQELFAALLFDLGVCFVCGLSWGLVCKHYEGNGAEEQSRILQTQANAFVKMCELDFSLSIFFFFLELRQSKIKKSCDHRESSCELTRVEFFATFHSS